VTAAFERGECVKFRAFVTKSHQDAVKIHLRRRGVLIQAGFQGLGYTAYGLWFVVCNFEFRV
jgi:hypothetical protein